MECLNLVFTRASFIGNASLAKLYPVDGLVFVNRKLVECSVAIMMGLDTAESLIANREMITSTNITEHVIRCFLIIPVFIIFIM
jgi:hypothetical protein